MIVRLTSRRLVGEGCLGRPFASELLTKVTEGGHCAGTLLPLEELCPGVDQLPITEHAQMEGYHTLVELNLCLFCQKTLWLALIESLRARAGGHLLFKLSCLNGVRCLSLHALDITCGMAEEGASPCLWVAARMSSFVRWSVQRRLQPSSRLGNGPVSNPACSARFGQSLCADTERVLGMSCFGGVYVVCCQMHLPLMTCWHLVFKF